MLAGDTASKKACTQFRAEAAVALTEYGHSPGGLDLLLFLREGGSTSKA
jgi:hypothetical protein